MSLKFRKTLSWPFGGDHWPQHWPEINLNEQTFSSRLDNHQKEDLIECMYNQAAAKTDKHRKPAYQMRGQTCTLMQLRGYFGKSEKCIKNAVHSSKEYEEYAKQRSRPPLPPEMSLVDKCTELDRPSQEDEASAADAFDRTARQDASPAQVVRTADRMGRVIHSSPAFAAPPGAVAGTKRAAPDPDPDGAGAPGALQGAGACALNCDVAGEALSSGALTVPLLQSQSKPLPPLIALTANGN